MVVVVTVVVVVAVVVVVVVVAVVHHTPSYHTCFESPPFHLLTATPLHATSLPALDRCHLPPLPAPAVPEKDAL